MCPAGRLKAKTQLMMRVSAVAALAMALASPPAMAATLQPIRSVAPGMYVGRWFQIAQILKTDHHPCHAGTDDFEPAARGQFIVTVTCHDVSGAERRTRAKGSVVDNSAGAKFRVSFLGGLINQEYWVLDQAADQSWVLLATPGGNFLWLMARRPVMDSTARVAALARIRGLGFDPHRLVQDR
jgi:apolipoprotein D and lipocalin family protein